MTAKEYVKQYYPDAYCEKDGHDFWIWAMNQSTRKEFIVGEGLSEKYAWADAKEWIDELSESERPKFK